VDLWLVRHGETAWNRERRFQGARDVELSARGREQAAALARALSGHRFAAVYTSPLGRTRETAAACGEVLGLVPTEAPDLREVGLGDWEGMTVDAVVERDRDRYWRWLTTPAESPPPGGEPMEGFQRRVTRALHGLAARHREDAVLAVTHGGAIAVALCHCLGLGLNALWRLRIENTSVTRLRWPAGRLHVLNDTRHLAEAAVPAVAGAAP
jgi:alpha-ribazole phosphatase